MIRKNFDTIKIMRERTEKTLSSARLDVSREFSGRIRSQFVGKENNLISTAELKICIEEIEAKLKKQPNARFENILSEFKSIYEPVKTCKFIPVVKTSERMLNVIGDEQESDPEILKVIKTKCEANKISNQNVRQIVESRENFYGKSYVNNSSVNKRLNNEK